jgi:hypothetical protein
MVTSLGVTRCLVVYFVALFQVLRLKPELPEEAWRATKMTLRITDRQQLWNVCMKSQHAR